MHGQFRGECTYLAESDVHFPQLTVSQTLDFASKARIPRASGSRNLHKECARRTMESTAQSLGISHVLSSKVGSDYVVGVSGGERKRTSIAEIFISDSPLHCWDNSTKGLDSANALAFIKSLERKVKKSGSAALVTLYQSSQDIYDTFDKVLLLYEGHQIFFGTTHAAKQYFTNLGFGCPERTPTSDFLTSLTSPLERTPKNGYTTKIPRSPSDFARIWQESSERAQLLRAIDHYTVEHPINKERLVKFQKALDGYGSRRPLSWTAYANPYSYQTILCLVRNAQRLRNDLLPPTSSIAGNAILSIILGSMFYNLPDNTSSFFGRGVLLFFIVLTNTFLGAFEGVQLWEQRPIVEKQYQYSFNHPSTEAVASMICDLPNKLILTLFFNTPFYFLANMRRTPSAFFTFYLFTFTSLLTGSMLFRTIGAVSKTLTSSIAPGADFILMLIIYTGFVLPIPSMPSWFSWFRYINPVGYAFESLMINEFSQRHFTCATFIPQGPAYEDTAPNQRRCSAVGSVTGLTTVEGNNYLASAFRYYQNHLWRNLGFIVLIMAVLCSCYLLATEYIHSQRSKGEILIFPYGQMPNLFHEEDEEKRPVEAQPFHDNKANEKAPSMDVSSDTVQFDKLEGATFLWKSLSYDVKQRSGSKRILDDIDGWIRPGTLTALMGQSGAGNASIKT